MSKLDMSKEYSTKFDELRRNRVEVSYYKYGPAEQNFGRGNVQAIPTLEKCLQKYKETGNGDYLCDIATMLCSSICTLSIRKHIFVQQIARRVQA